MDADLARDEALAAERLSASRPELAAARAEAALSAGRELDDPYIQAIAERALGLAYRELNDLERATRHLRRSIAIARRAGLAEVAVDSRTRLANVVALTGATARALDELQEVGRGARGATRARAELHEALVLQRAGEIEPALSAYRRAIASCRRLGLALEEAQARSNRAVLHTYRGEYAAAERDLERAAALAPAAGEGFAAAKVHHNLGFVAQCRGDIPRALEWYDQAQREFHDAGQSEAPVLVDRAETLLSVGLVTEALVAARRALVALERQGAPALDLAEARLGAARAMLVAGEAEEARQVASAARRAFARQGRPGWRALSDYVVARAALEGRIGRRSALSSVADELERAGWLLPAVELRLAWALAATRVGRAGASDELAIVAERRRRGPAQLRAHGWHAEALLRLECGDRAGALRALRRGLVALEERWSVLGATELRVHDAGRGLPLARLGLRLALESGRPSEVLEWAERRRAGSLQLDPLRPPRDRELDHLFERLRHLTTETERVALEGGSTSSLLRQRSDTEREIRDRSRHVAGQSALGAGPPTLARLQERLAGRELVEFVADAGRLFALHVGAESAELVAVGGLDEVTAEIDSLRFSQVRLARGRGAAATLEAFRATAGHAAARLEELLVAPLAGLLGSGPLVVVPTGRLHHLPWGALPALAGRAVSVAPSAALFASAAARPRGRGRRVVLVAGPGVEHAEEEIDALATTYPDAVVLKGRDATTERVAAALDGAAIGHLAAHGSFRADNPMFSSIQLADGMLTVYDLERLRVAPGLFVLSACESGLSDVHPGDELLGLSAALLALGTSHLLASVVAVPDVATAALMVRAHELIDTGVMPPEALSRARVELDASGEAPLVQTAGFCCFGR